MHSSQRARAVGGLVFIGVFAASIVAVSQPRPPQITIPGAALQRARSLEGNDDEALLAVLRQGGQLRSAIEPARFDALQVDMFDGTSVPLRTVVGEVTVELERFEGVASRAQAALLGAPRVVDAVVETPDSFVISKSVRVVVTDPAAFMRQSPEYRDYMQGRGASVARYASLDQQSRTAIDQYIRNEVPNLDPTNPLARAAAEGPDALLRAVQEGLGDFEITDTISFAKAPLAIRNGQLMHPTFRNGLFDAASLRTLPNSALDISGLLARRALEIPDVEIPDPPPRSRSATGGTHTFETEFLAGFTVGRSWDWERRWNFGVGFFRLSLGASYGYGLRFPMRVRGTATPEAIVSEGNFDRPDSLHATVRVESFDGDEAFYRRIGLPQNRTFQGRELVLEAGFYYGLKLNAFGVDWVHIPRRDAGFSRSADFTPPFGSRRASATIEIPPEVTGTRFGSRYLGGFAQFGVAAELEGTASIEARWTGTRTVSEFERMRFSDNQPRSLDIEVPALQAAVGHTVTRNYGIHLRNPRYNISASLVPMLRGEAHVDVDFFERSFSTGWIRLNAFRVPIASETFGAHAGTPREFFEEVGFNTFTRAGNDAPTADRIVSGNVALRARGGEFVRAGLSEDSLVAVASARVGGWERFEVGQAPSVGNTQGILLRSLQSQRYVRVNDAPSFRLTCTSNTASLAEQFSVHAVTGGFILQSRVNGRYLVAERANPNVLGATGDTQREATVFEAVAQP